MTDATSRWLSRRHWRDRRGVNPWRELRRRGPLRSRAATHATLRVLRSVGRALKLSRAGLLSDGSASLGAWRRRYRSDPAPGASAPTKVETVDIASLDDLAAKVAERRLVAIALSDLLGLAGRKRPTTNAFSQLTAMLHERSLATLPALPTTDPRIRVFRRDSQVAALIDAVLHSSEVGDQRLVRPVQPPEDGIARDLADLLVLTGHQTLEELSDAIYDDSDTDMWLHFPGEDEWSISDSPELNAGVSLHTSSNDSIHLAYPFPVNELWRSADDLEAHAALRSRLGSLYEDSSGDGEEIADNLYLGDVTRPCGRSYDLWGDGPIELADRDDPEELAIVRFLKSGEIQFRLGKADVRGLANHVRISNLGRGRAERVLCSADDVDLVADLVLKASAKRMRELHM